MEEWRVCAIQFSERQAVVERWRRRLREAEYLVDSARARANLLHRAATELPTPDSVDAYRQALCAQILALSEYGRVLYILSGLVLLGMIPDDD